MKHKLTALLFFVFTAAQAQPSALNSTATTVWSYFQIGILFVIMITFIVGAVLVYNSKSNANPDEFKKKLMNFIYGILFLFFALGMVTVIKTVVTSSLSTVF